MMRIPILTGMLLVMLVSSLLAQEPATPQTNTTMESSSSSADFEAAMNLYRHRHYQQAVDAFQKIVASDPKNAAAYYFMGYAHYVMKHNSEAVAAFGEAFKADPAFDPRPYFRR